MVLRDVLDALDVESTRGPLDIEITRVDHDSRAVQPGSLFCCVRGAVSDGHAFATAAVDQGARALLVDHELDLGGPGDGVAQVVVADVRRQMGPAAAAVWGRPSEALQVVGVTGTNGKTTTTHLLANILAAATIPHAVLGTLSGPRTTPEAPELQAWLAARRDEGVQAVAMEVSSHALALHRVDATHFAVAVFTNLTRDHLDFHDTMEAYFEAKARLFTPELAERAVVNLDDPHGRLLRDAAAIPTVGYSLDQVGPLELGPAATRFTWRGLPVTLGIGGRFNVANALAAAEAARSLGLDDATIAEGLTRPVRVPGRFEAVEAGQPFEVVVDYAHTPDALERLLGAAREIAGPARVLVVFGCGGDRDATKRPAMGAAAARGADVVVLTADNSRREDTAAIISSVQEGFDRAAPHPAPTLVVEPDRARAIALALDAARPGDIVVLAGKGHETTQTTGDEVVPFDDREVARRYLTGLGGAAS